MALVLPLGGKRPRIDPSVFLAPTAVVVGNVTIGAESSVWFGAVIRGDSPDHPIAIGSRTSIQENCVVHVGHWGRPSSATTSPSGTAPSSSAARSATGASSA